VDAWVLLWVDVGAMDSELLLVVVEVGDDCGWEFPWMRWIAVVLKVGYWERKVTVVTSS
jgi:hypothetical protein